MSASYPLTSWAHRTRAMCKGNLELVESDFLCPLNARRPHPLSLMGDIDDFLSGKISVLKCTAIIKTSSSQEPGACGNESLCFFYCPRGLP